MSTYSSGTPARSASVTIRTPQLAPAIWHRENAGRRAPLPLMLHREETTVAITRLGLSARASARRNGRRLDNLAARRTISNRHPDGRAGTAALTNPSSLPAAFDSGRRRRFARRYGDRDLPARRHAQVSRPDSQKDAACLFPTARFRPRDYLGSSLPPRRRS